MKEYLVGEPITDGHYTWIVTECVAEGYRVYQVIEALTDSGTTMSGRGPDGLITWATLQSFDPVPVQGPKAPKIADADLLALAVELLDGILYDSQGSITYTAGPDAGETRPTQEAQFLANKFQEIRDAARAEMAETYGID